MPSTNIFTLSQVDTTELKAVLRDKASSFRYISLESTTKDLSGTRFLDGLFIRLYSLKMSSIFYGHYHSIFERSSGTPLLHLSFKLVRLFRHSFPQVFDFIYNKLEDLTLYGFRSLLSSHRPSTTDVVDVFTSCLTSSLELDHLRRSIRRGHRIFLLNRNWDNPSTKSYISPKFVTWVTSWSPQMDHQLQLILGLNANIVRYTSPRFEYLRSPCKYNTESLPPSTKKHIYYVGSQKNVEFEIDTLLELSSKCLSSRQLRNISFIYRPHTWNPLPSTRSFVRLLNQPNISLDSGIDFDDSTSQQYAQLPINSFMPRLSSSLTKHLQHCDVLISPAGTLSLEAGLCGKPVIVDLTNYRQVTIKLHCYMDHFTDYAVEEWVKLAFSPSHILSALQHILRSSPDPQYIRTSSMYYADITHDFDLSKALEQAMISKSDLYP